MRIFDARDQTCEGLGLGAVFPVEGTAEVQEEAGGEYVLRMTVPIASGTGWEHVKIDRQITALCPVLGKVKSQRFRIHALSVVDNGSAIGVQARHISYDLQYMTAGPVEETAAKISAAEAAGHLWASIDGGAGDFSIDAQVTTPVRIGWQKVNVTRALLDTSGGLVRASRARLVRDNHVLHLLPSDDLDSGVTIRHGVDLIGLTHDVDATEIYTRLMPIGQDKKGKAVYLPEKTIDSPRLSDYALPRVLAWQVPGARVDTKRRKDDGTEERLTLAQVEQLLREAAQEKLDAGCDQAVDNGSVEYIDLTRVRSGSNLERLQGVQLYQSIRVIYGSKTGMSIAKQVCGYLWDPVLLRYTQLQLGDPFRDAGQSSFVTTSQQAAAARGYGAANSFVLTHLEDQATFYEDQTEFNNSVLVELNAQSGRIDLVAATQEDNYEDLDGRFTYATIAIDSMQNEILGKVSQTTYNADKDINSQAMSTLRADLNASTASMEATLNDHTASIETLATEQESIVRIKADRTELAGYVTIEDLAAGRAEIGFGELESMTVGTLAAGVVDATELIADSGSVALQYVGADELYVGTGEFDTLTVGGTEVSLEGHTHNYAAKSHTHSGYMASDGVKITTASTNHRFVLSVGTTTRTVPTSMHTHTVVIDGTTYTTSSSS